MRRVWDSLTIACGLWVVGYLVLTALADPPTYVPGRFRDRLQDWRLHHLQYRWAVDADCGCPETLKRARTIRDGAWRASPNYHPYLAHGDFDGDHREDVAVGVRRSAEPGAFRVLILSGRPDLPPILSESLSLGPAMAFGAPRPFPFRLVVRGPKTDVAAWSPSASAATAP